MATMTGRPRKGIWLRRLLALVGLLVAAAAIFHFVVLSGIPADPPRETAIADEASPSTSGWADGRLAWF